MCNTPPSFASLMSPPLIKGRKSFDRIFLKPLLPFIRGAGRRPEGCYTTPMIARITGTIVITTDKYLILETGGIGYQLFTPSETLLKHKAGGGLALWTTDIIREDTHDLYGFESLESKDLFDLLLTISGIGPRSALGIMNVATIGTIARAVNTNDVSYLTKISGIGKKTAEKIILELRDKLPTLESDTMPSIDHDAIDALIALGYSESSAREAVRSLNPELDTQTKIKEALRLLNK